ncbi:MAG: DUF374 domain-containing protein [Acidobacteria bacterium]|nr:MAG: DUF374 domain-containing protein [Acidobacteriota bacterium]
MMLKKWLRRVSLEGAFWLTWIYVRALYVTCRITIMGELERYLANDEPFLLTCWHQDMIFTVGYLFQFARKRKFAILVSLSQEGELGDFFLRRFGLRTVRGSSSRRGTEAIYEFSQLVTQQGYVGIIVCDGPRPPARRANSGIVLLGRMTGRPILLVRSWATRQHILAKTWPKFALVHPFSQVVMLVDGPLYVPADADKETIERYRREIEVRLNELAARAEQVVNQMRAPVAR